ncbi:PepSY domain-containing protein [Streptomyces sp. MP131-18]|uniref:PepSY-associated TM helix domain-containing protein n=1 Tax=Streptomyces sp. MP131-18 TaxID=1857892 RepID=UPI00097CB430|nr:PepSY domain-containing protein [Streptomyces sp. MP131-18]ONK14380.1 putative iron-regulated membrane protein [Streptomyces sp. MP131-18]
MTALSEVGEPEEEQAADSGSTGGASRASRASRGSRSAVKPLVLRLHFYAGLLVAPFLFVAAFSGLLYAASVQFEKIVYEHELRVPVGEERLPVEEQVAAARAAHPEGTVNGVRPGADEGATTRVLLDVPGLGPSHRLAVFVDPYTAEVRGALEAYGSSGALPVRWWVDELHRNLHLGDFGRHYSELAASWLAVIVLGGVVLWIGRRRAERRVRRTLLPERGLRGRRASLTWHGTVGLWIALGLGFLSLTGLTWSQHAGANITELRSALSWETPAVSTTAGEHADHEGHGGHEGHEGHEGHAGGDGHAADVGPDRVLAAARDEGLGDEVEIIYPAEPGGVYSIKETRSHWPVAQDAVAVDSATGEVTDTVRFEDWPLAAKLARWGVDAHMGLLFGLANQIVLMALACALMTVIVLGYRMWWQRRPTAARRMAWGRPPPRGAWRRAPWAVLVPLLALAAVVGYYVPLLGLSLLAFLAVDAALGQFARRGAGRP